MEPVFLAHRPLRLKWHATIVFTWMAVSVLVALARTWPSSLGFLHPGVYGGPIRWALDQTVVRCPFSVMEVCAVLLAVAAVVKSAYALREVYLHHRRLRNAVAHGALITISTLCMIDVWGGLVEGLHPLPLGGQLGLKPLSTPVGRDELVRWSREVALAINAEYTAFPERRPSLREIDLAIDRAYESATNALHLPVSFAKPRAHTKPVLFLGPLWLLDVPGYCSPYTRETYCNGRKHLWAIPEIVAHEQAHLRGVMAEDEANLMGYLACMHSDLSYIRYSGLCIMLDMLLQNIDDDEDIKSITAALPPALQNKSDSGQARSSPSDTVLSRTRDYFHDVLLRAYGESRGIGTYDDITLFAAYARQNGDSLVQVTKP